MMSKFSQNHSQSYCASSPCGKPGGGGGGKGLYLLHGLEGVLDDLAQAEVGHILWQNILLKHPYHTL